MYIPSKMSSTTPVSSAPSVKIPELSLKHSIQKHVQYKGIVQGILDKLKNEIPDIDELKLNPEVTKLVCNLVEAIVEKGNPYALDKQEIVLEILTKQFNLTVEEQNQINQQITFLFDNGQIKKDKQKWINLFRTGGKILAKKML